MKAVVLVPGGRTQLSSLYTKEDVCLTEFVNKPVLCYLVELLCSSNISKLLVTGALTPKSKERLSEVLNKCDNPIEYEFLDSGHPPNGSMTAALLSARNKLKDENSFIVFRGSILSDISIKDLLSFHDQHPHAFVTVVTTEKGRAYPNDPSGANDLDLDILSSYFKRRLPSSSYQECGVYLFRAKVLYELLSREDLDLDGLSAEEAIAEYKCPEEELCVDIGSACDYLDATKKYLMKRCDVKVGSIMSIEAMEKTAVVHPTAQIGEGCKIGPFVVIGPNSIIGCGSRLKNAVVLGDSEIKPNAYIENAILSWSTKIGCWARIGGNLSVIGAFVEVEDEIYMYNCVVFPYKSIKSTLVGKGIIL